MALLKPEARSPQPSYRILPMTIRTRISTAILVVAVAVVFAFVALPGAQAPGGKYPPATKGTVVDDYFGTKVADPYRWMEDLNAPEVTQWVEAQNAVTFKYLDDAADARGAAQADHRALELPEGLCAVLSRAGAGSTRATPACSGSRWCSRATTLDGAETVALDPNALSPDGSIALSDFVPSPDGQHFAYGQSEGGSDWSTYHVRELAERQGAARHDSLGEVQHPGVDEGRQGLLLRPVSGAAGRARRSRRPSATRRSTTTCSAPRSRPIGSIYERTDEPMLFIDADLDETSRYLFIQTNKGTSNKNELFVKDLGDRSTPKLDAPVTPLYPGHTAAYHPLGVVERHAVSADRSRGADQEDRHRADRSSGRRRTGRRSCPRARTRSSRRALVAGKLAVSALEDVAERRALLRARRHARRPGRRRPDLGTVDGPVGPVRSAGDLLHVHVAAVSRRRCSGSTSRTARARRSSRRS